MAGIPFPLNFSHYRLLEMNGERHKLKVYATKKRRYQFGMVLGKLIQFMKLLKELLPVTYLRLPSYQVRPQQQREQNNSCHHKQRPNKQHQGIYLADKGI